MFNLSDNYHLRKYYLKTETVPTQSMMKNKMKPALATVYFESMKPSLKQLAGLEPPLKGGGSNWYVPPDLTLKGRSVLKPEKKECLAKLNRFGLNDVGMELCAKQQEKRKNEKLRTITLNDEQWKRRIEATADKLFEDYSNDAKHNITKNLKKGVEQFRDIFKTSLNQVEQLISATPLKFINIKKNEIHQKMTEHFKYLVKQQSLKLHNKYDIKLEDEKVRLKNRFIENLEVHRVETFNQIHDLKIHSHIVLESIRGYLKCQTQACQVYISMIERDECRKKMERSQYNYQKKMRISKDAILLQDYHINRIIEKVKKRRDFLTAWQKKVQRLLKHLLIFIEYCLAKLPEQAEFFINLEKILLLQLSEVLENPKAHSIIVEPEYMGPVPKPHPFYLLCDKGYKAETDQDLCPKHCTSSATQLPVVVINKRFIYSACDNFEQFSDKLTQFLYHHTDDDPHLEDHHIYDNDVPAKYTSSQQLTELKLESSLLQILQEELNTQNVLLCPKRETCSNVCGTRLVPTASPVNDLSSNIHSPSLQLPEEDIASYCSSPKRVATRSMILLHEKEPKWESYSKFVATNICSCGKTIRKNLMEHFPSYMKLMSAYEAPELPNYETCSILSMKKLVKEKANKRYPPSIKSDKSMTRDTGTQYCDEEFESLCNCFILEDLTSSNSITGSISLTPSLNST